METIAAAAVQQGSVAVHFVPPPGRHHDVFAQMKRNDCAVDHVRHVQGFITSTGRFVSREEALPIAQAAGQMRPRLPGQYHGPLLFSEDLW